MQAGEGVELPKNELEDRLKLAAAELNDADAILIGAGAGMGVDSGLPDFRGDQGFWKAYPPFRGRQFSEMSNPRWFRDDPEQAWGFFGHRYNLYRDATPHAGFSLLHEWSCQARLGHFVFTSNVDGHFQRAGFDADSVLECHGSINHLQCVACCTRQIWQTDNLNIDVCQDTICAKSTVPTCSDCGKLARPNILMFGDYHWLEDRSEEQAHRYQSWLDGPNEHEHQAGQKPRVVAIEVGAGTAIPTVRVECESQSSVLIRINPRDTAVPRSGISIPLGGLDALQRINRHREAMQ